jgi:hypothetical protein
LASVLQGTVCKILAHEDVKPHKVCYYQAAKRTDVPEGVRRTLERRDETFETKTVEVLCVNRAVAVLRAAEAGANKVGVISDDEKPGIQAIGNTAPDLPPKRGVMPPSHATMNTNVRAR